MGLLRLIGNALRYLGLLRGERVVTPDTVLTALLLTNVPCRPWQEGPTVKTLVREINRWTDEERAEAFNWASMVHLKISGNAPEVMVNVPPEPECVTRLREMRD